MLMKRWANPPSIIAAAVMLFWSIAPAVIIGLTPAAHAAGDSYIVYMDPAHMAEIKKSVTTGSSALSDFTDGMQYTTVYAKINNSAPVTFAAGSNADDFQTPSAGSRTVSYYGDYYCDSSNNKIVAAGGAKIYHIYLKIAVKYFAGPPDLADVKNLSGTVNYFEAYWPQSAGAPESGGNKYYGDLPLSCIPQNLRKGSQTIQLANYTKLSSSAKGTWPTPQTSKEINGTKIADQTDTSGNGGGGGDNDPCDQSAGKLAWVLCPAVELLSNTANALFKGLVIDELKYQPLIVTGQNSLGDSLYKIWGNMLILADITFVLIFLYILIANMLSFNVNAYTIKKMLPRLVAAAILVQASFLVCALLIDIGNILGGGIQELVKVAVPKVGDNSAGNIFSFLGDALGAILGIGALAAVAIWVVGAPTILLFAIGAFFGVISVVVTLVLRKLIISVLIIFSPLAFAAWVLPGTENIFKTWWKTLTRVILMYPLIVIIFSMATILAAASRPSGGGSAFSGSIQTIVSGLYPIIAFFLVPWTFKWAGGVMNATSGLVNRISNPAGKASQGKFKDSGAYQRMNQNRDSSRLGRRQWLNDKLDKTPGLGGTNIASRVARGTLGGVAGFAVGAGTSNKLEQQRSAQKLTQDQQKELKDLGVTNPKLLEAIAMGSAGLKQYAKDNPNDNVAHLAHYAGSTHGQAAALRTLAQDGKGSSVEAVRLALDKAPAGSRQRLASEEVFSLGTTDAGDLFGSDPAVAFGGLDAKGKVQSGVIARTNGESLAKQLADGGSVARTFGGNPGEAARADSKWSIDGGSILHLDTTTVEKALTGVRADKTSAAGRIAFREAFTGAQGQATRAALAAKLAGGGLTPAEQVEAKDALERFDTNKYYVENKIDAYGALKPD